MRLRQAANGVLRNDVMLRINGVALRANGELQFCCTLTQKSLFFKGFCGFKDKKHPSFTMAAFLNRSYVIDFLNILWYN